jgi:AraC-like DNA-binding protein
MTQQRQSPLIVDCFTNQYAQHTSIAAHSVPWGELNFALNGVLDLEINQKHYTSPPQYAIWIPPHHQHSAYSSNATLYVTLLVDSSYCEKLPKDVKLIEISPILLSIVHDFIQRKISHQKSEADQRLAHVLIDQIQQSNCYNHYLPWSHHPKLEPILQQFQQDPASLITLQQCAALVNLSERHLLRLSQQELYMSLNEWKNRAKLLMALNQLDQQHSVQQIASHLGYQSSSAFISMFQRMTGKTPQQMRNG